MPATAPLEVRLMRRVVVQDDGCWRWTGSTRNKSETIAGYGQIWTSVDGGERRLLSAHRAMYELKVGPIPEGLDLDHLCHDVDCVPPCLHTLCVNPEHLTPTTRRDNILRGKAPAAVNARKERCPKGHRYTLAPGGRRRECKPCQQAHRDRYRAERLSG